MVHTSIGDMANAEEASSRTRAAAWAWYQRSGGSIAPALGKSEAFAVRCKSPGVTSRFGLEAHSQRRLLQQLHEEAHHFAAELELQDEEEPQGFEDEVQSLDMCASRFATAGVASIEKAYSSSMASSLSSLSTNSSCVSSLQQDAVSQDMVALDPLNCWDCGSSLFDSFELVSMSEKLHSKLDDSLVECLHLDDPSPLFESDSSALLQPFGSLPRDHHQLNTVHRSVSPSVPLQLPSSFNVEGLHLSIVQAPLPSESPSFCANGLPAPDQRLPESLSSEVYTDLKPCRDIVSSQKYSKQAIYDMFCHYGSAESDKVPNKEAICESCNDDVRDNSCRVKKRCQKPKHRVSFNSLSKAIKQIAHLKQHGHSHQNHNSDRFAQNRQNEKEQQHHHHHHLPQLHPTAAAGGAMKVQKGDLVVHDPQSKASNMQLQQQPSNSGSHRALDELHQHKHVHHVHHHHHYHYLFHSDDAYRFPPLDKSLVVAAAGLRTPKLPNPSGMNPSSPAQLPAPPPPPPPASPHRAFDLNPKDQYFKRQWILDPFHSPHAPTSFQI